MKSVTQQHDRKTVLVVDDEADLRELLALELVELGYQVVSAESGEAALKIVLSQPVDLVISDIRMPNGDGLQLLDRIKEINRSKPVVILTTGYADITIPEAFSRGAQGFFLKPIDYPALFAAIEGHLSPAGGSRHRKCERYDVSLRVEVSFESKPQARSATLNIGRGGMFVVWSEPQPEIQEPIKFQILFDDRRYAPVDGRAVVRWKRTETTGSLPAGIGLEFAVLSEEASGRLDRFLGDFTNRSSVSTR